jgi:hypothetical protein
MGAEVGSAVANAATRFWIISVTEIVVACGVLESSAIPLNRALAARVSRRSFSRVRDNERAPSPQFLTNEIHREARSSRLKTDDFHRSRRGDKRFESAENCTLAHGELYSVT